MTANSRPRESSYNNPPHKWFLSTYSLFTLPL